LSISLGHASRNTSAPREASSRIFGAYERSVQHHCLNPASRFTVTAIARQSPQKSSSAPTNNTLNVLSEASARQQSVGAKGSQAEHSDRDKPLCVPGGLQEVWEMTDLIGRTLSRIGQQLRGRLSLPGDDRYVAATAIWAKPVRPHATRCGAPPNT
jgi:hypothetical protein